MKKSCALFSTLALTASLAMACQSPNVFASEASDAAFEVAFPGGVLDINSAPITEPDDADVILGDILYHIGSNPGDFTADFLTGGCNEDYTLCQVTYMAEEGHPTKDITINYHYDEAVLDKTNEIIAAFNEGEDVYYLSEAEFVNYLEYYALPKIWRELGENEYGSFGGFFTQRVYAYSDAFKSVLDHLDIWLEQAAHFGTAPQWYPGEFSGYDNVNMGKILKFNDVIYPSARFAKSIKLIANPIITISEGEDIDIPAAVEARLKQLGLNHDVSVTLGETKEEFISHLETSWADEFAFDESLQNTYDSAEDYVEARYAEYIANENGTLHYLLNEDTLPNMYNVLFRDEEGDKQIDLNVLVAMSDTTVDTAYTTSSKDFYTDIEVSYGVRTPFDAAIEVNELDDEAYAELAELFGTENFFAVDLNLYSASLEDYVTTGNFTVHIPTSLLEDIDDYKIYYVAKDGDVYSDPEEITAATLTDETLSFPTSHFSTYAIVATTSEAPNDDEPGTDPANPSATTDEDEPSATAPDTGYMTHDTALNSENSTFAAVMASIFGLLCGAMFLHQSLKQKDV